MAQENKYTSRFSSPQEARDIFNAVKERRAAQAAADPVSAYEQQQWKDDWGKNNYSFFGMNPDTLSAAIAATIGANVAGAAFGGTGAAEAGTSMFSPEAAGAYQSFTAPAALEGVSYAPELASLGSLGGSAAGTSMFAPEAAGGYQAFTPPSALTSVPSVPDVSAFGVGSPTTSMFSAADAGPKQDFVAPKALTTVAQDTAPNTLLGNVGQFLKDNKDLGMLAGGLLGAAASKDTTTSSSKDPWAPAQPYLKDNLAQNAAMQQFYAQNPFSDLQKTAYQGLFNTLANNQAGGNALLSNAAAFGQSRRGVLPQMAAMPTGTQAPAIDWNQYKGIGLLGGK